MRIINCLAGFILTGLVLIIVSVGIRLTTEAFGSLFWSIVFWVCVYILFVAALNKD